MAVGRGEWAVGSGSGQLAVGSGSGQWAVGSGSGQWQWAATATEFYFPGGSKGDFGISVFF